MSAEAAELALALGEDAAAVRAEWVGGHRTYLDGLTARCAAHGPHQHTAAALLAHLAVMQDDYSRIFKEYVRGHAALGRAGRRGMMGLGERENGWW